MANINITYKGLIGTVESITIDDASTIDQLIAAIAAAEGLSTDYYSLSLERDHTVSDVAYGDSSTTLADLGIVDSDYILCTTKQAGSKEDRQIQKLEIAQVKRQAGGDTTKTYYRVLNTYDAGLLPDTYNGNESGSDDNPNTGGLVVGRPWTTP